MVADLLDVEGGSYEFIRAADRKQFEALLEQPGFDLILCDFNLPDFDGLSALKLARNKYPGTPVILVSGAINSEEAVECLKAGATDYLLKQRLERLPSAVERALKEARVEKLREAAEAALRESEERFRQLANTIDEVFWLTDLAKAELVYVSPGYEALWGRTRASLHASPREWLETIHPEDRERVLEAAFNKQITGEYNEEYRIVRPDGAIRWIHDRAFPVRNQMGEVYRIAGVARDITNSKLAEEVLRASNARLADQAKMLSSLRDAVVARDLDQRIYYWNTGAERLYGWTAQEAFGCPANTLLHSDFEASEPMKELLRTGEWTGELSQRHKDGSEIIVESFWSLLTDDSGEPTGVLSINTDITARKHAEQARIESEKFAQASLNALGAHVAVLDERGVIIAANRSWREFARINDGAPARTVEGVNYLEVCEHAEGEGGEDARRVAAGIRAVIRGETGEFVLEYPCHSPEEQRWFLCRVTRFPGNDQVRVAVAHENVTLVKQVQEQLDESKETFRTLARVAPVGIFRMDDKGRCNYVNRHWRMMTGLSEEQALGEGWSLAIHPEDRARVRGEWNEAVSGANPFRSGFRLQKPDGTVAWVIAEATQLVAADGWLLGYVGTAFNITEQKQTEAVLRSLSTEAAGLTGEAFFQFIAGRLAGILGVELGFIGRLDEEQDDAIRTLAFSIDDQLVPNFHYSLAGTPCENVIAKDLCIYPSDVQQQFPRDTMLVEMGIAAYGAIPLHRSSGGAMGLLGIMSRRPLRDPKHVEATLKLFAVRTAAEIERQRSITTLEQTARELTEAKLALEAERTQFAGRVAERTRELSVANAELKSANRLKSEFLANMSHELRTPLNAILGLSESLMEQAGTLTPRQLRSATTIHSSGQHLLELINDILDLSKVEAGKLELHPEPVNVEELCQSCLGFVKTQATKKQITVACENCKSVGSIHADPKRLKQILVNLLTNAVKFTPEGGSIGLIVDAFPDEEMIRFTVWDTGIGITPEDAANLFQAFTQIDSGLNRLQDGTGLGLALVAKLADLHGGSVALSSEPGRGSRFTVTLPLPAEAPDSAPPGRDVPRAMIIEDDPNLAAMLGQYLTDLGYRTILLGRGDQAMAAILREMPDVILMDIHLPGMSGWDVLKQMKTHPEMHAVPVLVVTGVNEPERSRALGAAGHLTKPFTPDQFVDFFERSIGRPVSPAEPEAPRPSSADGPLTRGRAFHFMPVGAEILPDDITGYGIIINHEDMEAWEHFDPGRSRVVFDLIHCRKSKAEVRAMAQLALDLDHGVMPLENPKDHRQSQPRTCFTLG